MRYIKNFAFFAIAAAMLVGCKEETVIPAETSTPAVVEQIAEPQQLPTYFNGEPVQGFSQLAYIPSSDADMELLSVNSGLAMHYFDQDAAFRAFCEEHGQMNVYEANAKLDIVHAKAVELGLTEENGAKDDGHVPQEMADLWYDLFGYNIEAGDGRKASLLINVYEAPSPDLRGSSKYKSDWFILPMKRTLGKMNGKISMIEFTGSTGITVFCYKTWFGGTKEWFFTVNLKGHVFVLTGTPHDKKFHSYFTTL